MKIKNPLTRIFFYVFLFSFIISHNSFAQLKPNIYTYQAAQVEFWYPNDWQLGEEEKVATLQNLDGTLSITFSIMQADLIEEALIELEAVIQTQLSNPNITAEPEVIDLQGMEGIMIEVTGNMDGIPVQMGIFIIDSPQNVLLVLGVGHKETLIQHNKELNKIIKSIQPI